MDDDNALFSSKLRQSAFEFQGFVDRSLDEGFHFPFSEGREDTAAEASQKALCSGEAYAVPLVAGTVEDLDSFGVHHPHEFFFLAAFVIMVAEDGNDGDAEADEGGEHGFHFGRFPIVGEVSGENENVGFVAHTIHLIADAVVGLRCEMSVGCGGDSHAAGSDVLRRVPLLGMTCLRFPR